MNKAKEEKGLFCIEVIQVTPPGYWPGSLVVQWCLCSCVIPSGYYPGLLAVEQPQRWKFKLWRLYYLCTNIPLIPNWNNCPGLAWNVCRPTKGLVDATFYNQAVMETKMNKEINNTSEGVRLYFHEQGPFRELEFYHSIAKCCSGYNHPPKFFLSFVLESPYLTILNKMSCTVKYMSFIGFSAVCQPMCDSLLHSPHWLLPKTWSSCWLSISLKKLRNYGGGPVFLLEIEQILLEACWAQKLCNPISQPSQWKLCNLAQQDFSA